MRLKDIIKSLFVKKQEVKEELSNKYYNQETDKFRYVSEGGLTIDLKIESSVEQFPNLYLCELKYGHTGGPLMTDNDNPDELKGFEHIYIGFDKDTMKAHENYCEYVFTKLLDIERIRELYAREFEQIGIAKLGNYVGSIVMEEKQIKAILNHSIGQHIEQLPETKTLHDKYDSGYALKEATEIKQENVESKVDAVDISYLNPEFDDAETERTRRL